MKTYATSQQAAVSPSFSSDIQGGLHDLGTSVSQGLKAVGGVMQRNGMPEWGSDVSGAGSWVDAHTPTNPAGLAPSQQLGQAIKNGDWSSVPGLAVHSIARAAPSVAPILAADALSGQIGAAVTGGALALGPEAYARPQNNGEAEPSTADVVSALPGAAVSGAGAYLIPGAAKAGEALLLRSANDTLKAATGGAIMDAGAQLGGSVGTDRVPNSIPTKPPERH